MTESLQLNGSQSALTSDESYQTQDRQIAQSLEEVEMCPVAEEKELDIGHCEPVNVGGGARL